MENISEFLYLSFHTALFCLGIYVLSISISEYKTILNHEAKTFENTNLVSEIPAFNLEDNEYTKGYIISLLLEPLEYNIQVDGYLIEKHFQSKAFIKDYNFLYETYEKHYKYDDKGNISKIIFIGK